MSPQTTLLVTFAGLVFALTLSLLALGQFMQGYLYSQPASRMPVRALVGGLILGGFLTFWVYANTRAETKDRYGTLFEFTPTKVIEFHEFEAVRRYRATAGGAAPEKTVPFKRSGGGRTAPFVEAADPGKSFALSTADYMTVALEVKNGEGKGRYDAELNDKGQYKSTSAKVFRDRDKRFIEFGQSAVPSAIQAPSSGAFAAAVGLNLLNFVIWFAVFWPVMKFTLGHALGLATIFGGVTMLLLMPLLFQKNQVGPVRDPAIPAQKS